jgi:uncharacterized membrane protein affecting hemolysin expression
MPENDLKNWYRDPVLNSSYGELLIILIISILLSFLIVSYLKEQAKPTSTNVGTAQSVESNSSP